MRHWTKSRLDWIRRILGAGKRLTPLQLERTYHILRHRGWITAMPVEGPAYEQIVFVRADQPVGWIVADYQAGQRHFRRTLEAALGVDVATQEGVKRLAKCGFALTRSGGAGVALAATDPREAKLVNEARRGIQRRGFGVRGVVVIAGDLETHPITDSRRAAIRVADCARRCPVIDIGRRGARRIRDVGQGAEVLPSGVLIVAVLNNFSAHLPLHRTDRGSVRGIVNDHINAPPSVM